MRNDFIFNGVKWATEAVNGKAQADFYDFSETNAKASLSPWQLIQDENRTWARPEANVVKINVDAGVSKESNQSGTGAILARDNTVRFWEFSSISRKALIVQG